MFSYRSKTGCDDMEKIRAHPSLYPLWAGFLSGLFVSTGLNPQKAQAQEINEMLELFYSALPTDRVSIPIFWFKALIFFILVIIPLINTGMDILASGKVNMIPFLIGIASGYLMIFNSTVAALSIVVGAIVVKLYPRLIKQ
jgi:hypothetical protein